MKFTLNPTYLFISLTLALTACSQDDILPENSTSPLGNMIAFRTSFGEPTSRADITTKDNLKHFYVTAFDFDDPTAMNGSVKDTLFSNQRIDIIENKDVFSSPFCCWPNETKESDEVSFFGFHPGLEDIPGANLVNESTATTLNYKLTGFKVEEDIAVQKDFITAYTSGSMAHNYFTGIMLNFNHQLSRIEIKAHGRHKSCDIEIAGVRIGGVGVEDIFDFKQINSGGVWSGNPQRGIVEYIYGNGDKIVTNGVNHPVIKENAVSIMGKVRKDGKDNCAMLIPAAYDGWEYTQDPRNAKNQLYISVLLRVTDATPSAGKKPVDKQRFPYRDLSQGANALDVPRVYLAVNKTSGEVSCRLYKKDNRFYEDMDSPISYDLKAEEEIKEFGWAALPISCEWEPGKIYTYTLDYSYGVGLLDPEVTQKAPAAGDPVISDKVGISYSVTEWIAGGGKGFAVPGS